MLGFLNYDSKFSQQIPLMSNVKAFLTTNKGYEASVSERRINIYN